MLKLLTVGVVMLLLPFSLLATPSVTSFSTTASVGGVGSVTITAPTSISNGNLLLAGVAYIIGPITPPAGWSTTVADFGAGLSRFAVFQRTASSESGDYLFQSASGGDFVAGGILNIASVAGTPIDIAGVGNTGTGTTATYLSITTTKANDLVVAFQGNDGVGSCGVPASFAANGEIDGGASEGYCAGSLAQAAAGASGSKTSAAQTPWCAVLIGVAGTNGPPTGSQTQTGMGK